MFENHEMRYFDVIEKRAKAENKKIANYRILLQLSSQQVKMLVKLAF